MGSRAFVAWQAINAARRFPGEVQKCDEIETNLANKAFLTSNIGQNHIINI